MKVTLTFDNGPCLDGTTDHVLRLLKERGAKASFFVTGDQLRMPGARALAERASREGHWIGNHTMTHTIMFGESDDDSVLEREIGATQKMLEGLGHADRLFRPCGGGGVLDRRVLSRAAIAYLVENRYSCVLWNSVPKDWLADAEWVERCLDDVVRQDWSVIVMHDLPTGGMKFLPNLLDALTKVDAEIVQEFPNSCVPIRRGEVVGDLEQLTAG
jgi:peptidoglycan/xylan/chitin deacetylase (PgdA/CDA1 family)